MESDNQQKSSSTLSGKAIERSFIVGQRGVTEDCIGIGRGGGFVQEYNDLIIYPNGNLEEISFTLPSAPDDFERSLKGNVDIFYYKNILSILDQASFYNTTPDQSSTLASYIFVARTGREVHVVEWGASRLSHPQNSELGTIHFLLKSLAP